MNTDRLLTLRQALEQLEEKMQKAEQNRKEILLHLHPQQKTSGRNLLHYLALRSEDIRSLQDELHIHGLSSLASSESHIQSQLQAILQRLGKEYSPNEISNCTYEISNKEIHQKADALFGNKSDPVVPYIMVTADQKFVNSYAFVKNLLQSGMNVARINCAHDNEAAWSRMIFNIKKACQKTGLSCKIYMDLPGPKIRTIILGKGQKKEKVSVHEGQLIHLVGENASYNKKDIVIGCTIEGITAQLKKDENVLFDDGIIEAVVEKIKKGIVALRVQRVSGSKTKLKAEKGINFPDSHLTLSALTDFDKTCIPFICEHADLIGYSFVRNVTDLIQLQDELKKIKEKRPTIIIKIETPEAVKNLPGLLLQGMYEPLFGVMIARGDLAVEIGFERMSEIQEEILWICEAAHAPVIWATQVLETLNKSGFATRSEITDAAHAAMAECVMINKGDYTIEAIETLRDILHRSGGHHVKKRYTFRPLSIAARYMIE